jgi:hypothetical protein
MESIAFIKATARGNDFLLVDTAALPAGSDLAQLTSPRLRRAYCATRSAKWRASRSGY